MTDNIVSLDVIRIDRNKPRKCTCEEFEKHFTVDTKNREVTCECGQVVDPFEAMRYLAEHYERIEKQHKNMDAQRKQWMQEKPHSVLFKGLERDYQRGKMLPHCPSCGDLIDYKDITSHGNAEFWRKWKEQQTKAKE